MNQELHIINGKIFSPQLPEGFYGPGFVTISNERIKNVGLMQDYRPDHRAESIDAGGSLVMPGLVNGHNHAAMTLFRGMADDLPLMTWLENHIFPAEAQYVRPEMVYWTTKLAAAEMILSGTTTVADAYFYEDEAARAFAEAGMRAIAAHGIIDFPAPGVPDPSKNISAVADFITRWQADELITPAVFAHSPYTCSSKTLIASKELARRQKVPFFVHLAETAAEKELIKEKWQGTPTAYLHSLGVLDAQTICVHAVWLDAHDISLLAKSGAAVVSCPESNMKLAAGVAPLGKMRKQGIPIGLGTDGCASNNNLDLLAEMDTCAKLHKVHDLDPTGMPARDILDMATAGGAKALGLADAGRLAPGMLADLIIVDQHKAHLTPFYSVDNLVYAACGADVKTMFIHGRPVMQDRKILTFDVAEAMERVAELAREITGTS